MTVHAYTSITANYIPKARVLAHSLKGQRPDIRFHLVLNDKLRHPLDLAQEPFDSILSLDNLPITQKPGWIFQHSVVELCTAVKGIALLEIVRRFGAEKVFYFDPDIVVFGRIDELVDHLDSTAILLTPHLSSPEESLEAIMDNEIAALKHGVFNLGFLGVRARGEGLAFASWWTDRLLHFCYDEIASGLFTDQRWIDLVPCFFSDYRVLRSPAFNVATWNLTRRQAEGSLENGVLINGEPLGFYHFSGFDSGAQRTMLNKYGSGRKALYQLRDWYIQACEESGQRDWGTRRCCYDTFDDGTKISREHRMLYRSRLDLRQAFPDPFKTRDATQSFLHWWRTEGTAAGEQAKYSEEELDAVRKELDMIKGSRTWRIRGRLASFLAGRKV